MHSTLVWLCIIYSLSLILVFSVFLNFIFGYRFRVYSGWRANMFWKHWRKVVKHCWHCWKRSCTIRWSIGRLARTRSGSQSSLISLIRMLVVRRHQQLSQLLHQRHPRQHRIVLDVDNQRQTLVRMALHRGRPTSLISLMTNQHETHWKHNLSSSNQNGYEIGQFTTHAYAITHTQSHIHTAHIILFSDHFFALFNSSPSSGELHSILYRTHHTPHSHNFWNSWNGICSFAHLFSRSKECVEVNTMRHMFSQCNSENWARDITPLLRLTSILDHLNSSSLFQRLSDERKRNIFSHSTVFKWLVVTIFTYVRCRHSHRGCCRIWDVVVYLFL